MPNPWNNPYVPGDPFSYDLKWIIKKLKEHGTTIQQILEELPDDSHIKEILQQMIDDGEITALALQSIGVFNVKDYGAKGDGVTDDAQSIRDCYDAAVAASGIMYFPSGTYRTFSQLRFPDPLTVVMEGEIYSDIQMPIVVIGDENVGTYGYKQNWNVRGIGYANTGSVGVLVQNVNLSNFTFDFLRYVETGVIFRGCNNIGLQNNTVRFGEVAFNRIGVVLLSESGGWCNENLFLGGRIMKTNDVLVPSVGILITSTNNYYNNNNVFIKPNLEKQTTGVEFDYGNYNTILYPRMEAVTNSAVYNNASAYNRVITGYGITTKTNYINHQEAVRANWAFPDEGMKFETLPAFGSSSVYNASAGCIKDFGAIQTTQQAFQFQSSYTKYTLPTISGAHPIVAGQTPYVILTGPSYTGAIIDVKSDGRGVFWWQPVIVDDHGVDGDGNPIHVTRGVFIMYDDEGNVITTAPKYFPGSVASTYTAGNTTFFRFGYGQYGYAFIIPEECATIFAGVELASGETEGFYTMAYGSNIPYAIRRHDLVLSSIPTSTNSPTGTMVSNSAGTDIWVWNKSSSTWVAIS